MSRVALIALVLALVAPPKAFAQRQELEPWEMTEAELEADGWEYEGTSSHPGSVAGGLLAVTLGTLIHGVGHFQAGDARTGTQLLVGEGIALGFLGLGLLTETFTNTDGDLASLYRASTALGASLFVVTWLLDVIGTFKGTGWPFPDHSGSLTDVRLTAAYLHLVEEGLPLVSATRLRLEFDMGAVYVNGEASVGIGHAYLQAGVEGGIRFGLGRRPLSYLDIRIEGEEVIFGDLGFGYESIVPSFGVSLDLGDVFAHLDGVVFENRIGAGIQFFRFDFDGGEPLNGDSNTSFVLFEAALGLNPSKDLLVEAGYVQRPDTLVGSLSEALGLFFFKLTYAVSTRVDFFVDTRFGEGFQLFSGTTFYFRR